MFQFSQETELFNLLDYNFVQTKLASLMHQISPIRVTIDRVQLVCTISEGPNRSSDILFVMTHTPKAPDCEHYLSLPSLEVR